MEETSSEHADVNISKAERSNRNQLVDKSLCRGLSKRKNTTATLANNEIKTIAKFPCHKPFGDLSSVIKQDSRDSADCEQPNFPTCKRAEPIGAATETPSPRKSPMTTTADPGKHSWNKQLTHDSNKQFFKGRTLHKYGHVKSKIDSHFNRNPEKKQFEYIPNIKSFKAKKFDKFDYVKSKIDSHLTRVKGEVAKKYVNSYADQHRKTNAIDLPKSRVADMRNKRQVRRQPPATRKSVSARIDEPLTHALKHHPEYKDILPAENNAQNIQTPIYGILVPWQGSVPLLPPVRCTPYHATDIENCQTESYDCHLGAISPFKLQNDNTHSHTLHWSPLKHVGLFFVPPCVSFTFDFMVMFGLVPL